MKHSKEPWIVSDVFYSRLVISNENKVIARVDMTYHEFEEEERANAQRIVDCVNACAGMENPVEEIAELKQQLTWRSAINEPPKNEGQQLCRWSWQDNCHFRHYDLRFGWGNVTEKEIKDLLWLPIPKE